MKKIAALFLAAALVVPLAAGLIGCKTDNPGPLVGSWTGNNGFLTVTYTFKSDGSYTGSIFGVVAEVGTYTVDTNASTVTMTPHGSTSVTYGYIINGNTLTLTTGGNSYTFTKQ
ncbi:MAG TPA: DUF5640 domain-containing protein [Spirochaetia bacterium]|nr:DUF5640 domain-containing protein [Spirochaetia bacterium]